MVNYCCDEDISCRRTVWCTKIAVLKIVRKFLCKVTCKWEANISNPVLGVEEEAAELTIV
jgi:hypothetical protein